MVYFQVYLGYIRGNLTALKYILGNVLCQKLLIRIVYQQMKKRYTTASYEV